MPFGPDQLPITVPPLPGEALDSWLEAYARRLRCGSAEFLDFLGLTRVRAGQLLVSLLPEERDRLAGATGVDHDALVAMTLWPFDGLAVTIKPATRGVARPPAWRRSAGSRYCPPCLDDSGGRWRLAWRLPWSFACLRHRILLVDQCPACQIRPVPSGRPRSGVSAASTCTTLLVPAANGRLPRPCGQTLLDAAVVEVPPAELILDAQQHVERLLQQGTTAAEQAAQQAAQHRLQELCPGVAGACGLAPPAFVRATGHPAGP